MADIFISYARSDRSRAQALAEALEELGYFVWWDPQIPPGKTFDEVIAEALGNAKCVVVLWSKESVKSEWVKEEASVGKRRSILVPALIDDVELPLGFGLIQAADLTDWEQEKFHSGFDSMIKAIALIVGRPPAEQLDERVDTEPPEVIPKPEAAKPESPEPKPPGPKRSEPEPQEEPNGNPILPILVSIGLAFLILLGAVVIPSIIKPKKGYQSETRWIDLRAGDKKTKSFEPKIKQSDTRQQMINLLERNAQGWNTNDIDLVMGVFHKEAQIILPGKPPLSWHEYEKSVRSRIKNQSVHYSNCSAFEEKQDRAWLDCIVKIVKKQQPAQGPRESETLVYFEFIRESQGWYVLRVTTKP